jgi:hypothetical protein
VHAQEVVHALCGTVRSIDSTNKTITVVTDSGTSAQFKETAKPEVRLDFDKRIHADVVSADAFTKNEAHVIAYYYGNGDVQTAVAFQDLGTGPFEDSSGTVVKFDRHERVLTLKKASGAEVSFHLDPKTVAETPYGAMEGLELDAKDGDQLQVTASSVNGNETALFIRTM